MMMMVAVAMEEKEVEFVKKIRMARNHIAVEFIKILLYNTA